MKSLKAMGMAASFACAVAVTSLVTTGCAGDQNTRSTGTYIDDAAVSTKVKTELLADKQVKGTEVKVRTYGGDVQLSGFVDSPEEKTRAVEIARAVPGVRVVRDDLVVKIAEAPTVQEPAGAQTPAAVQEPNANK